MSTNLKLPSYAQSASVTIELDGLVDTVESSTRAMPAGTGDVLTGLLAVPAALALATGTVEGRKGAMLWNMFGLADLAVAITLGMIMSPGPFQLIITNGPSMAIDTFPNVLTPAFVVPSSILLHALSLRQLFRHSRAGTL